MTATVRVSFIKFISAETCMRTWIILGIVLLLIGIGITGKNFITGAVTGDIDCESIERQTLRDTCYADLGALRQDINLCNRTSNEKSKFYCYKKVAERGNISALCTQITDTYWADLCYQSLGMKNNEWTLCTEIENDRLRDACFDKLGRELLVGNWCRQIREYPDRLACMSFVGKQTLNPSVCDTLGMTEKEVCRYSVAIGTKNESTCQSITFPRMRSMCIERVQGKLSEENRSSPLLA